MGDKTGIEWTDATWNPVRGCSRVSEGCRFCYAETVAARFSGPGLAYEGLARRTASGEARWTGEVRVVPEHLADPLRWKRPRRIFVNSMSDLFHERVTNEQIAAVFGVMAAARRHTFQVLTKRPRRAMEWFEWARRHGDGYDLMRTIEDSALLACAWEACSGDAWGEVEPPMSLGQTPGADVFGTTWPLPNVWLGVSVENQPAADERVPMLLQTPAAVRFLSCEPLLGPVDLSYWLNAVDWVICGGESGPGARPMHPDWARDLRDQCKAAGVPYFFKQNGAFIEGLAQDHRADDAELLWSGGIHDGAGRGRLAVMRRVGKKAAGSLLDGVEHKAFPKGA